MEQNQPQQRHAAAQEFQESLHQLQNILHQEPAQKEAVQELDTNEAELDEDLIPTDLADFESAVADIEQYLADRTKT
ncbi:hypothetical protein [Fortiea contorta]|uniref:hypothetical protein n=1 Tax=Fortiea contorta TaxID=1892405 RepID=UPI0003492219|nr:hypothetical protein [Fortiea contorta]